MNQLNLHKQKLYALIFAGIAFASLLMPWVSFDMGMLGGRAINGFRSWGLLSLFGVIGVAIACFIEDRTIEFSDTTRRIATASFSAIFLGALIFYLRLNSNSFLSMVASSGVGLWICQIAGVLGLLWTIGALNLPDRK